ncbi:MAG TPA: Bcr/CflA family multidrug efflux MFS transporter [Xanthobacteraceae bacterium]|jgi:DHA1 family bicyclomycin/chloramphenicol resistance-like MFS transporter
MTATQASGAAIGQGRRIFIFGFLSAIAPLSIDIYLPALPTLRQALAADEAQTLYTLSTFFIGFGGGQLLFGPLTDRFGRKRPLLVGLAVYIAASAGCALAPSIGMLIAFRFIQALGGSIVPIAVQAMVRDLYARNESARILSLNMLVTASAPVVAPLLGGQILLWLDWRFIFWVLVGFGALAFVAATILPETLAAARRSAAHPLAMLRGYAALLRDGRYLGYVACSTAYFCCLFAFIAGSPFVYIEYFGVPPQFYGFLFGVNMIGMIATTFTNSRIVMRRGADALLRRACIIGAAASLVLLATGISGFAGVAGIVVPLFVVLALLTMVGSNAISGALAVAPSAGAAAALAGALQFGAGAFISAATGWLANGTPQPMVGIICAGAVLSLLANLLLLKPRE